MKEGAPIAERIIISVDLAKNVFEVQGAAANGSMLFRKKLLRPQLINFAISRA